MVCALPNVIRRCSRLKICATPGLDAALQKLRVVVLAVLAFDISKTLSHCPAKLHKEFSRISRMKPSENAWEKL